MKVVTRWITMVHTELSQKQQLLKKLIDLTTLLGKKSLIQEPQ